LPRPSRATPPLRCSGLLPCHQTHLPMRHGLSQPCAIPCISRPSSRSLGASQHLPRPRLARDQPFPACVSDESRTRTAHTQPAHTQSKLLACRRTGANHAPAPRVDRGHALLRPRVGGESARTLPLATCPSQSGGQRPRRRRQAGPHSGRPRRPRAGGPLASPPAAASSCTYLEQVTAVRYYWIAAKGSVPTSYG
jgi:hypothetical protein